MEQASAKRPADFAAAEDSLQKRSRLNGYGPIDTSTTFQRRSSVSSRSPGSPRQHPLPSAEVAADFKDSLQDLQTNDRWQISNLTIIAKESTEHAMAISRVLENHIRTTSPPRKLPALYVLDSIVKNVGTPYTIYLGQNLYKTFMDAYTLVDGQTRKNMEGMLKTWKEPIPGSMEARPVFPLDIVRPIENALIKARTMFVQQQQQQARSQRQFHALPPRPAVTASPQQPWISTPTPSQTDQTFAPPPQPEQQRYTAPATDFQYGNSLPPPPSNYQSQQTVPNPYFLAQPPTPQPTPQYSQQPPLIQPSPTPPPASFQNSYSLVALLQAAGTFTPAPQQHQQPPISLPPPPQPQIPVNAFPGLEALFQQPQLVVSDLKNNSFTPLPLPVPAISTPIPPVAVSMPSMSTANTTRPVLPAVKNDVQLTISSLKIPRPHLLTTLYTAQPSQCTTCGRRFTTSPIGKARKARHLDAHFSTNRRLADAVHRAVSRSWFVDELDWIRSREVDDADEPPAVSVVDTGADAGGDGGGAGEDGRKVGAKREVYVRAPADAAVARHACPICQEEFRAVWLDGAQEWVWMDAVGVAGRAYHKSCVDELAKDRGGVGMGLGLGLVGKKEEV